MTFAREIRTREIGSVGWIGLLEMNIRAALAAFQRENVLVIKNSLLNVFYFHTFLFLGFFSFVSSHHSSPLVCFCGGLEQVGARAVPKTQLSTLLKTPKKLKELKVAWSAVYGICRVFSKNHRFV